MKRSKKQALLGIVVLCFLTGCSRKERPVVSLTRPSYEKLSFQAEEVYRGDLNKTVSLELTAEGYQELQYQAPLEELTLEKVHVSVGEHVRKGEILVSFRSEETEQSLKKYQEEKEKKELLLSHYEKLMALDEELDYAVDIKMLQEDIAVAQLYLEEETAKLASFQIRAKEDGIITQLSEYLQNDVLKPGVNLLTQVSGTGNYLAVMTDAGNFSIGESYAVSTGGEEYEFRLTDIQDSTLIFQPVSGKALVSSEETLTLTPQKQELKDVVYVNRHAIYTIKGNDGQADTYCVYVLQENGYQRAVFVTPGERILENQIILEGLSGGEKVVIR